MTRASFLAPLLLFCAVIPADAQLRKAPSPVGEWSFTTPAFRTDCTLSGEMTLTQTAADAFSCSFDAVWACKSGPLRSVRTEQTCAATQNGANLVMTAKLGRVVSADPPETMSWLKSAYAPDNFVVTLNRSGDQMDGMFRSYELGASEVPPQARAGLVTATRDILIVGGGLAGLFLALKLAPRRCTLIALAPIGQAAASAWAQGGLAAALSPEDDPSLHAADTVAAGAGIVDPVVARLIAEEGPNRVRDLLDMGVPFDRTADGELMLSLEAAHSRARVARVSGDLAGKAIMEALSYAVAASSHIEIIERVKALALLQGDNGRIAGVLAQDRSGETVSLRASETVLCAGGSGGLYAITTNPRSSQGDALAMAYSAGALIGDPEFVQFHPTAIDIGRDPAPLATEALRGEGAHLVDRTGRAFMNDYHKLGDLAPRDEVARAIHAEREAGRGAYLDCRKAVGSHFPDHFPTVFEACMSAKIDPRIAPIPVAPAMHYHMGGIVTDLWGRTSLEGLSACGESASTGAHGANRLASNSLLEAVVFANRVARRLRGAQLNEPGEAVADAPPELAETSLSYLRKRMHSHCGVIRNAEGLEATLGWIHDEISRSGPARALVASSLIVSGALARQESRGGHYRSDFPEQLEPHRTFLRRGLDGLPEIHHVAVAEAAKDNRP